MQCPALEMKCFHKCPSPEHCRYMQEYGTIYQQNKPPSIAFWLTLGMILWIVVLVAADYIFNLDLLPL